MTVAAAGRSSDLDRLWTAWSAALNTHLPDAVGLRRALHAQPMLSGEEEPTAQTLEDALGVPLQRVAGTGRIGRIGPPTGPAVALRAELDALPMQEDTAAPYAATNGRMHACGHDVHQAALVAVVWAARGLDLPYGLVTLLQPREETYPSGARDVVESDCFSEYGVAAAIGAHVHPAIPVGSVATGAGVVNAAADEIEIVLHGRGGHGAYPHRAVDPVAALAHIVLALPELVRRTVSPMNPATISVGHLQAGAASANVLPASARLLATMRTTDAEDRRNVQTRLRHLATNQAAAFGLEAAVTVHAGEPVLSNDPALVERIDRRLSIAGVEPTEPMRSLGADDFSYFGAVVPSVMCFVGVQTDGHEQSPELHHAQFLPTDDAVALVATALISGYLGAAQLFGDDAAQRLA